MYSPGCKSDNAQSCLLKHSVEFCLAATIWHLSVKVVYRTLIINTVKCLCIFVYLLQYKTELIGIQFQVPIVIIAFKVKWRLLYSVSYPFYEHSQRWFEDSDTHLKFPTQIKVCLTQIVTFYCGFKVVINIAYNNQL